MRKFLNPSRLHLIFCFYFLFFLFLFFLFYFYYIKINIFHKNKTIMDFYKLFIKKTFYLLLLLIILNGAGRGEAGVIIPAPVPNPSRI